MKDLSEGGEKEVPSSVIGERIMERLRVMDEVAYVRFASVYRSFRDVTHFMEELQELLTTRGSGKGAGGGGGSGSQSPSGSGDAGRVKG